MKVILSRKGFDSATGGRPSPVLPDGTLLSLPIPYASNETFADISHKDRSYAAIMSDLGIANAKKTSCHVDPDLYSSAKTRAKGWRGAFGQSGAALGHLQKYDVGVDDLFLFFGWFRPTETRDQKLRYLPKPDLHVIYGYLQIGQIIDVASGDKGPRWLQDHPHLHWPEDRRLNTIYLASEKLSFAPRQPGFGVFNFAPDLVLTKEGHPRGRWHFSRERFANATLTYHPMPWKEEYFQSSSRGQEFITGDADFVRWAQELIKAHS